MNPNHSASVAALRAPDQEHAAKEMVSRSEYGFLTKIGILVAIVSPQVLQAQVITGFDSSSWTLNSGNFQPGVGNVPAYSGLGILDPNTLQLNASGSPTLNTGDCVSAAWYNTKVAVTTFQVSFTWEVTKFYGYGGNFGPADGFTFVFQNQGLNATGGFGYGLGYFDNGTPGISKSAGLEFRTYGAGTGYVENAAIVKYGGDLVAGSPVDLTALNHPIDVKISYDGTTLKESLKDQITGGTFSVCYTANIAAAVGASTAYVGFTGGTGNGTMDDFITNFSFTGSPGPTGPIGSPCPVPEPSGFGLAMGAILGGFGLVRMQMRRTMVDNAPMAIPPT